MYGMTPICFIYIWGYIPIYVFIHSLVAQMVKNLSAMQETQVWSLGWEEPLEKRLATHSSILAWRMPWTEESGDSMGSQSATTEWNAFTVCLKVDHKNIHQHIKLLFLSKKITSDIFHYLIFFHSTWILLLLSKLNNILAWSHFRALPWQVPLPGIFFPRHPLFPQVSAEMSFSRGAFQTILTRPHTPLSLAS